MPKGRINAVEQSFREARGPLLVIIPDSGKGGSWELRLGTAGYAGRTITFVLIGVRE
jgi:hypothetical protein